MMYDMSWTGHINPYISKVISEGIYWDKMKAGIKYLYNRKKLNDQVMLVQANRCLPAL